MAPQRLFSHRLTFPIAAEKPSRYFAPISVYRARTYSHTLTHPSARAQGPAQTTRSIGTVDLVQGAAVEAHSPSPSPALRRALP